MITTVPELSRKSRPCTTAVCKEDKNPKFIAVAHSEVSFEKEPYKGGKKIPTAFTVVDVLSQGWSKVPLAKSLPKNTVSKKISELITMDDGSKAMKMWSFEKAELNMERGERVDDLWWVVQIGDTFNMWFDETRVKEFLMRTDFSIPGNRVPPMSVCEIEIQPRNAPSAGKGSGVRIVNIKIAEYSLYSCFHALKSYSPTSLNVAKTRGMRNQADFPPIAADIQTDRVGFFVCVEKDAFIDDGKDEDDEAQRDGDDDRTHIHIVNCGNDIKDVVDISVDVLCKYTNVNNVDHACQLLEVAIAMESLYLYVVYSDYKKNPLESGFKAIPVIDTEKMLAFVDNTKLSQTTVFKTPYTVLVENEPYTIEIEVQASPVSTRNEGFDKPLVDDLILASMDSDMHCGYPLAFKYVPVNEGGQELVMAKCCINTSPTSSSASTGFKRRKITPL